MAKPRVEDPTTRAEIETVIFKLMDAQATHAQNGNPPLSPEAYKDLGLDAVDEIMELLNG